MLSKLASYYLYTITLSCKWWKLYQEVKQQVIIQIMLDNYIPDSKEIVIILIVQVAMIFSADFGA